VNDEVRLGTGKSIVQKAAIDDQFEGLPAEFLDD
jgi:hypothetical protein